MDTVKQGLVAIGAIALSLAIMWMFFQPLIQQYRERRDQDEGR